MHDRVEQAWESESITSSADAYCETTLCADRGSGVGRVAIYNLFNSFCTILDKLGMIMGAFLDLQDAQATIITTAIVISVPEKRKLTDSKLLLQAQAGA